MNDQQFQQYIASPEGKAQVGRMKDFVRQQNNGGSSRSASISNPQTKAAPPASPNGKRPTLDQIFGG